MSEEQAINKCPSHGELEEKVSGVKDDIREMKDCHKEDIAELRKLQKEDNQELKLGQKEILKKIDRFMEVRIDDFKACGKHRNDMNEYVDTKVGKLSKSVKINADKIAENDKENGRIEPIVSNLVEPVKANTKFRNNVKYYILAVATLAAYMKFFV